MLKTLVKTYFRGNGGLSIIQSLKNSSRKKGRKGVSVASYIGIAYLALLYMWIIYTGFMTQLKISVSYALAAIHQVGLMLSVFFTLTSVDNILVKGSDLDTLRSLPIPQNTLTFSRFVILYTETFTETLIVFLPFAAAALINTRFSPVFYLLLLTDALVLPLFSAFFMGVFSYLAAMNRVMKRLKTVLIYALSFLVIWYMLRVLGGVSGPEGNMVLKLEEKSIVTSSDLAFFAVIVSILLLSSAILLFVCVKLSDKAASAEGIKEKPGKVKGNAGFRQVSVTRAMMRREIRIMFSSSAISTELIMELVMPLFLIVIYAVMGILGDMSRDIMSIPGIEKVIHLALYGLIYMLYSFTLLSSTSVSREGGDFDMSKLYPVSARDRVIIKLKFHLLLTVPAVWFFLLAIALLLKAPVMDTLFFMLLAPLYEAAVSAVGLAIDYRNPHTVWQRPQEAVKQNMNGLGAMGISMLMFLSSGALFVLSEIFLRLRIVSLLIPFVIATPVFLIFFRKAVKNAETQYVL
ncbi:MAG: hypothetical protein ACI4NM_03850 [Bullifex sp.]